MLGLFATLKFQIKVNLHEHQSCMICTGITLTVGVFRQTWGSLYFSPSLVRFKIASAMAALVTGAQVSDN